MFMYMYLAGEKLAGENAAGPGLRPTDVCLLLIAASGVVCGLLTEPLAFAKRSITKKFNKGLDFSLMTKKQ